MGCATQGVLHGAGWFHSAASSPVCSGPERQARTADQGGTERWRQRSADPTVLRRQGCSRVRADASPPTSFADDAQDEGEYGIAEISAGCGTARPFPAFRGLPTRCGGWAAQPREAAWGGWFHSAASPHPTCRAPGRQALPVDLSRFFDPLRRVGEVNDNGRALGWTPHPQVLLLQGTTARGNDVAPGLAGGAPSWWPLPLSVVEAGQHPALSRRPGNSPGAARPEHLLLGPGLDAPRMTTPAGPRRPGPRPRSRSPRGPKQGVMSAVNGRSQFPAHSACSPFTYNGGPIVRRSYEARLLHITLDAHHGTEVGGAMRVRIT